MANQKAYIVKEALGSGVVNGLINGAFAWYLSREKDEITVWGEKGMVVDFLFTAMILVFLLSLIVLPLQRRKLAKHPLTSAEPPLRFLRYLGWAAPLRDSLKALLLAIGSVVVSLPLLWVVFALMGGQSYSPAEFTLMKSIYTGLLSVAVVPLVILFAMHPVRRLNRQEGEIV